MNDTQFEFSYAPGTTQEQILGFEMAGEIWSQYLTDNVTINIHVEMTNQLPENVIGGALPGMKKDVEYKKVREKMLGDISSRDDWTAFYHGAWSDEFTVVVDGQEIDKVKKLKLTNANSKALDLIDGDQDKLDGYIVMSDLTGQSNIQWEYDFLRDGNIADNSLDFVSVALHEVGHVLGFASGVDDGDWLNVVTEARDKGQEVKGDAMKFVTPLDLFRYSDRGYIDLSMGANAYFSIDGGQTNLGNFSTGEYSDFGGDGYQASHWKQSESNALGIMDPVLKLGQQRAITSLDTMAMDVTGWDVVNPGQLNWQELYDNALDEVDDALVEDRDKDVEKMVKESENYKGRRGNGRSRSGSWQVGFWQNIKFQTLDVEVELEVNSFQSESNVAQMLFDNYAAQFDSSSVPQNEFAQTENEDITNNELVVTEVTAQLIEHDEIVNSESSTLNWETSDQLLSGKLEDILNVDGEPLVMPIS